MAPARNGVTDALVHNEDIGCVTDRRERDADPLEGAACRSASRGQLPGVNKLTRRLHDFECARDPQHRAIRKPIGDPIGAADAKLDGR
jgi:hypothetical protein